MPLWSKSCAGVLMRFIPAYNLQLKVTSDFVSCKVKKVLLCTVIAAICSVSANQTTLVLHLDEILMILAGADKIWLLVLPFSPNRLGLYLMTRCQEYWHQADICAVPAFALTRQLEFTHWECKARVIFCQDRHKHLRGW